MPQWLAIFISVLSGISAATAILAVWLRPLFKMRDDLDNTIKRVEKIEEHQDKDYKARLRNEQLQKAQVKALIALLNCQISGFDKDKMIKVRDNLQNELTELI